VVGHAFFWSLRAGLHEIRSYERFYLILERFLMCCGKYKEELFRQDTINAALVKVHHQVKAKIDWGNAEKKKGNKTINVKDECESTLYNALKETEFIVKLR
jgi:hypothetical protein